MNQNKKEKDRRKYCGYIIDRGEENIEETPQNRKQNLAMSTGKKQAYDYAESVGYHLDPSHYDSLRDPKGYAEKVKNAQPAILNGEVVDGTPIRNQQSASYNNYQDNYDVPAEYDIPQEQGIDLYDTYLDEATPSNNAQNVQRQAPAYNKLVINNEPIIDPSDKEVANPFMETPVEKKVTYRPGMAPGREGISDKDEPTYRGYGKYVGPSLDLLNTGSGETANDVQIAEEQKEKINEILKQFNIHAHVEKYIFGPTVIEHLVAFDSLNEDVKSLNKIENNLSMYLETTNVRLLLPIPGMKYAGIEVPRPAGHRGIVYLRDLLSKDEFKKSKAAMPIAVGRNNFGKDVYCDIKEMPHGLCAGTTKSGKSVCLNSTIMSLIYHLTPDDIRFILIDPKIVEFNKYQDIPHLAMPIITDSMYFEPVLTWLVDEMERRYKILDKYECVDLAELNEEFKKRRKQKLPYILMVMDEFSDWFADASKDAINSLTKLLQKSRAAGLHIILAAQHPSADIIKGSIKANLGTKFAFKVESTSDAVVILGQGGAEKLEGYGDLILRYAGKGDQRMQATLVTNSEIKSVTEFLRSHNAPNYLCTLEELEQSSASRGEGNGQGETKIGRNDEKFAEVAYYVVRNDNASVNSLQKVYGMGFNRMNMIFEDLERLGIISKTQKGTARKVLVNELELENILKNI